MLSVKLEKKQTPIFKDVFTLVWHNWPSLPASQANTPTSVF